MVATKKILKSKGKLVLDVIVTLWKDKATVETELALSLLEDDFIRLCWQFGLQKWANVEGLYRDSCGNNGCLNLAKLCETGLTCLIVLCCTEQKQLHYFGAGWKHLQDWSGPNVLMDFLCSNSPAARPRGTWANVFNVVCVKLPYVGTSCLKRLLVFRSCLLWWAIFETKYLWIFISLWFYLFLLLPDVIIQMGFFWHIRCTTGEIDTKQGARHLYSKMATTRYCITRRSISTDTLIVS